MGRWQITAIKKGSLFLSRYQSLSLVAVCVFFGLGSNLQASDEIQSGLSDHSLIGTQAFSKVHGRLAVNQAAGEANVQTNSHALGENANVQISIQTVAPLASTTASDFNSVIAHSEIETASFAHFEGLLGVNQVSGQQNTQANLGVIGTAPTLQDMSDKQMLEINSNRPLPEANGDPLRFSAQIAQDSLQQAKGIIQINQISGSNNTAVNQFSLQLPNGD